MKTFGPIYVGKLEYYHNKFLPIVELGTTRETDMPYRAGKCLVFRIPFTKPGFYAGILYKDIENPQWLSEEEIDNIISNAMKVRDAWNPEDGLFNEVFKKEEA